MSEFSMDGSFKYDSSYESYTKSGGGSGGHYYQEYIGEENALVPIDSNEDAIQFIDDGNLRAEYVLADDFVFSKSLDRQVIVGGEISNEVVWEEPRIYLENSKKSKR